MPHLMKFETATSSGHTTLYCCLDFTLFFLLKTVSQPSSTSFLIAAAAAFFFSFSLSVSSAADLPGLLLTAARCLALAFFFFCLSFSLRFSARIASSSSESGPSCQIYTISFQQYKYQQGQSSKLTKRPKYPILSFRYIDNPDISTCTKSRQVRNRNKLSSDPMDNNE